MPAAIFRDVCKSLVAEAHELDVRLRAGGYLS
jgi:hypothetical protein